MDTTAHDNHGERKHAPAMLTKQAVLDFWFSELQPRDWWRKSETIDAEITQRFAPYLQAARRGELFAWRDTAVGRLAEIIVLDQFARHIHRDNGEALAGDMLALLLAQEAVRQSADLLLTPARRAFLYMPFMHSESATMQAIAVRLFDQPGLEGNLRFARRHRDIIARFGRFPHRNALLGRVSSEAERAFLRQPGSRF